MQKITLYCDSHHVLKDELVPVEATKEYNLGDGPKNIELCADCEDSLSLKDLRRVLDDAGRAVIQVRQTASKKATGKGNPKINYGEYPCRFCSEVCDSPQTRGMHEFRHHPWQRLLWEKKHDYVRTNKLNGDDLVRRQKWMDQLTRLGISLEEAADREVKMGPISPTWSPDRNTAANRILAAPPSE